MIDKSQYLSRCLLIRVPIELTLRINAGVTKAKADALIAESYTKREELCRFRHDY